MGGEPFVYFMKISLFNHLLIYRKLIIFNFKNK